MMPTTLWFRSDETVLNYIASKVPGEPPEKALRVSDLRYESVRKLQMLIPTDMVNDNDYLGLGGKCWERNSDLTKITNQKVDWMSWGVVGDPDKS
jgi:hypothetical protein